MLRKQTDNTLIDPKLEGSLTGEDRINYWNYLKQFISEESILDNNSNNDE